MEAFCYACFPWIVRWLRRMQQRQLLMIAGVCWVAGTVPAAALSWAPKPVQMFTFDPLLHLPAFIAGAAVGRLYVLRLQDPCSAVERWANWVCVAGIAGLLAAIRLLPFHAADGLARTGILIPFFCAIVYGLAAGTWFSKPLSGRAMNVLGEASYSAYLLQYVVWYTYFAVVKRFAVLDYTLAVYDHRFAPFRFFALAALLMVVSIVSFRYFESPARRYLRARLGRPASLRMASPASGRAPLRALSIPPNTPIKTFD